MKKFLVFTMLIIMLSFPTMAIAGSGIYVGIGGSRAIGMFDVDDGYYESYSLNTDSDDTNGFKLKMGYQFNNLVALEFAFDRLGGFKGSDVDTYSEYSSYSTFNYRYNLKAEVDIQTFILAAKITPWVNNKNKIKPFVTVGIGIMQVDYKENFNYSGDYSMDYNSYWFSYHYYDDWSYDYPDSYSLSGPCVKIGAGLDLFITNYFALGTEIAYIQGVSDVSRFDYMNYTGGITVYF